MANLTKIRREKMLAYLEKLKTLNNDVENIRAISEIENALNEKKYGLVWEEHTEKVNEMLKYNIPVFVEDKERKIFAQENGGYNFLLEGDNLHSLKLLEKTHNGKIDVIYIDPPYNRGKNDFIYNDDYVDKADGYTHSKWISFMKKRLDIASMLLSDEGIILISIDDNEQAQLKMLCDDIFGKDNFIETFCWNKTTTPPSLSKTSRSDIDYIHVYQKKNSNKEFYCYKEDIKSTDSPIQNKDNPIGVLLFKKGVVKCTLKNGVYSKRKYSDGKLLDDLIVVDGRNDSDFRYEANLKWSQEYLNNEIDKGTEILIKSSAISIRYKKAEERKRGMTPNKLIDYRFGVGTNDNAKSEIDELNIDFSYPKPTSLIKFLLKFDNKKDMLVLDFFAGSGTTAQAVLELNKEDGGNRKFILCTDNQNNICEEVTYRRIKKVIQGYEFIGKKETVLYEKKLTVKDFKNIQNIERLISEEERIKKEKINDYDKIKATFKDGVYSIIGEKNYKDKVEGINANLKYYKTEFIPKFDAEDSIADSMLEHIKELIELEHHIEIDDKKYIILDDEDEIESALARVETGGKIFVASGVFLSRSDQRIIDEKEVSLIEIPEYYFREELREAGEL